MKKPLILFFLLLTIFQQKNSAQENKCEVAENNKKIVLAFYQQLFGDKDVSVIDQYLTENYIQHNPGVADGRQALKDIATKWLANQPKSKIDFQQVAADGDLVFLHIKTKNAAGTDVSLVDIFRLKDSKIVEHWDLRQDVPEKSANPHPMF
jgi:predicted SnoaL-like aldol condensation-catalyzing enzyme